MKKANHYLSKHSGSFSALSDSEFSMWEFCIAHGYSFSWNKPITFNEKMSVYKVQPKNSNYWKYTDKLEVRSHVEKTIGTDYLIPLIGVFDSVDNLKKAISNFPKQFVIKTTHASGWNVICKDNSIFSLADHEQQLRDWMETNFYTIHRETNYKNIVPKLLVETFVSDSTDATDDYKFFCFDGKPTYIQVDSDRFTNHQRTLYTTQWKKLPLTLGYPNVIKNLSRPSNLAEMLNVAEKLSKGFPHVRVDLYLIDNKIYFGELTFSTNSGLKPFDPFEWDIKFGKSFKIPVKKPIKKKSVVYTCITAHYDELYNHTYTNPDWDYVCFTDDLSIANENNSHWQLRPLQYTKLDNTKNQRWHKLHPHLLFPDYEYSLWVDSNLDIMSPAVFEDVYMAINNAHTISIAPHPERDCLYDEMQACLDQKKDTLENMNPQIDKYKKDGFPAHYGLFETNIMLRKHHLKQVKKVMNDWWFWVEKYSKRDQLSLTYVLWKNRQRANSLSKKSYRSKTKIISFWPHLSEIRNYYQDLSLIIESQQEQIVIKNNEIEILKRSLETIQSAKVYRLWQGYNSIKRSLRSKLSV